MFRPTLADSTKVGFFRLDRASQTESTDVVDLKEMTEVLQTLLHDAAALKRDINFTKHVIKTDHESKLMDKSMELYCRINEKVAELEKVHQDRVSSLRKAFRQQLADAISRLSVHFSKNFQSKMTREKTKQLHHLAGKDEKFKEMQATILRNEGVIQMMKAQLEEARSRQKDDNDDRFMSRNFEMEDSPARLDSGLQEQLDATHEQLEDATQKLEQNEKTISRLEEAINIKDEEITTISTELDNLRMQFERSSIMIEQLKHEHKEMENASVKERESSKQMADDLLNNQKEHMKKAFDEQVRMAKEEAMKLAREELSKSSGKDEAKMKEMASMIAALEKQLQKEKDRSSFAIQDENAKKKALTDSEDKLKNEISKLKAELEKAHKTWEKKFMILQQSMFALKDESYLRQSLQKQATQLRQAAVSYSVDKPVSQNVSKILNASPSSKKPLPSIHRESKREDSREKDFISYTVSAASGIGTPFSPTENQIMLDNEMDLLPSDATPLPQPIGSRTVMCSPQGVTSVPHQIQAS